ncbi:hypothetical protein [Prevotella jejuni]
MSCIRSSVRRFYLIGKGRQDASQLGSRTGSLVRFCPRTIVFRPVIANYFHEE